MSHPSTASCETACQKCVAACEIYLEHFRPDRRIATRQPWGELCQACIKICSITIEELRLDSSCLFRISALCAVMCRACADECRQQSGPDGQDCAAACLVAAHECRALAVLVGPR